MDKVFFPLLISFHAFSNITIILLFLKIQIIIGRFIDEKKKKQFVLELNVWPVDHVLRLVRSSRLKYLKG